ncbi:MAG: methyltransferase domain-containing protein [Anaerolineales bacterium]
MNFSGERYLPTIEGAEIGYEHWHRYLYATHFAKGKDVLDIACGEGYGTYLLSQTAGWTVGIDISNEAIRQAAGTYRRGNLEFNVGSVSSIPVPGSQVFDGIVSFETIEHVAEKDQEAFLGEVKRLLKQDGFFLVSTPDKLVYSDEAGYRNEFHLKEFYLNEFSSFLARFFKHVKLLGQRVYPVSYIWDPERNEEPLVEFQLAQTERGLLPIADPKSARYLIAWCSDLPPSSIPASIQVDVSQQMTIVRDRQIAALAEKLSDKEHLEQQVVQLERQVRERSERVQELEQQVRERSERVQELEQQVRERSERVRELEQQVRERSERVQGLEQQVREQSQQVQKLEGLLANVVSSRSWRLTEPFRTVMAALRGLGRHH